MKIAFVVPKDNDRASPLSQFAQCRVLPPVGLGRMAGLAGKYASVSVVDERIASARHNYCADIAVFIINNYNRERCFGLSKIYRDSGAYVVLSGLLLAKEPLEPDKHADTLFMGHGEECMAEFLSDFTLGKTKSFYRSGCNTKANVQTDKADCELCLAS